MQPLEGVHVLQGMPAVTVKVRWVVEVTVGIMRTLLFMVSYQNVLCITTCNAAGQREGLVTIPLERVRVCQDILAAIVQC